MFRKNKFKAPVPVQPEEAIEIANPNPTQIRICPVGAEDIYVDPLEEGGDTVASVLERAGIIVAEGFTVKLGKQKVIDPVATPIQAGDTLVIGGKPDNG